MQPRRLRGHGYLEAAAPSRSQPWIAGELGRVFIAQERIQGFCWCELPVKWSSSRSTADVLAQEERGPVERLAGLVQYAGE
jgi:hypothetical protein